MPLSSMQMQFIQNAAEENRIAHLCIDNQAFFPFKNSKGSNREAFFECSKHITDVSNTLAPHLTSIQVMYEIPERARMRLLQLDHTYQNHLSKVFFDEKHLKVSQTQPVHTTAGKGMYGVVVDFLNPDYSNHHVHIKREPSAFSGDTLDDFLQENKKDVILVSGMYLSACVHHTLCDMRKIGIYQPIIIEDATLDFNDNFSPRKMFSYNLKKTRSMAKEWGVETISSQDALRLIQR